MDDDDDDRETTRREVESLSGETCDILCVCRKYVTLSRCASSVANGPERQILFTRVPIGISFRIFVSQCCVNRRDFERVLHSIFL